MEKTMNRCGWVGSEPIYVKYHDTEWGVPVHDDRKHFEFLILESAQAGLSWITVLKRREGYRRIFYNFEAEKVAKMTQKEIDYALTDPGIIRNKLKVEAAVNNAKIFISIQKEFGSFDKYVWGFVSNKPIVNRWKNVIEIPATSTESDKLSADLRSRGMSFVGSTIIYAHMQATGLVNDHLLSCFRRSVPSKLASPI
jgi:DNA-3-methyladenine glycosylase I